MRTGCVTLALIVAADNAGADAASLLAGRLPWLADPLGAENSVAPYADYPGLKPAACPAPPKDSEHVFTLYEVVELALCNNPDTRGAFLSLLTAGNSYVANYSGYLPTVNATASLSRASSFSPNGTGISRGSGISAAMTLYDFGQRELGIEAAEQTLISAGYGYDATLQGTIAGALSGYYTLLTAQNGVSVARESERFAEASYEAAKLKHEIGQVALADELQAKSSYSQAVLATQQAENSLALNKASLARLMGLPPDGSVAVAELTDEALTVEPFGGRLAELMEQAPDRRVDLLAQRAQLESARIGLKQTQRGNLATVTAGVNAGIDEAGVFRGGTTRDHSIGLSVSIPIFSGFTQTYNERNARLAVESQEQRLIAAELGVKQDVWNAWHNYQTAQLSWTTSLDLLASATELKDVALGRYKEGIGTILDVLNAQSQYRGALQSHLNARYNLLTTRIDLVRAVGVLDLETMNPEAAARPPAEPHVGLP